MKTHPLLEAQHILLAAYIKKDDVVIDATMGNGQDTLFLAPLAKHVYAFDIQKQAIENTQDLIEKNHIDNVTLILDSHENFDFHVKKFQGAVFNLGYLPGGDHTITTKKETTISTLTKMLRMIDIGGYISVVCYPGHKEGMIEASAIDQYLNSLSSTCYQILRIDVPFARRTPPYLYMIQKIKDES